MKTIKAKIADKGITINQVAKMVGIDRATLSRIINNKQSITAEKTVEKIHHYLDALNSDDENIFKKDIK